MGVRGNTLYKFNKIFIDITILKGIVKYIMTGFSVWKKLVFYKSLL